jgi:hypothetical protein
VLTDYYAVLQVHPDADFEVIEAAYRQLMKKHHPDVAGDDQRRAAEFHERAKAINQAFSVLRDPERRRQYDRLRLFGGIQRPPEPTGARTTDRTVDSQPRPTASRPSQPGPSQPPPPSSPPSSPPRQPAPPTPPQPQPAEAVLIESEAPEPRTIGATLLAPLSFLSQAYYLLPGPYEWEKDRQRELVATLMVPVLGISAFLLMSGRLEPYIGDTFSATMIAWGMIALCALPLWQSIPRVAAAAGPTVALASGTLNPMLAQAHIPVWIAAVALSFVSLIVAARVYLFGVIPTLAACWLLMQLH